MAGKKIQFSAMDEGHRMVYEELTIPDTLSASKLHMNDIKIRSKKGGSDGELALLTFIHGMSNYTQENFVEYHEAKYNVAAYIHIKYMFEGARAELT